MTDRIDNPQSDVLNMALDKVKADALREAAYNADMHGDDAGDVLRAWADRIEKEATRG